MKKKKLSAKETKIIISSKITETIKAEKTGYFLEWRIEEGNIVGVDTNLPYRKQNEDWQLLRDLIDRLLKERGEPIIPLHHRKLFQTAMELDKDIEPVEGGEK